jgi:hypothetical protein
MKNKKAQLGNVVFVIVAVILSGFLLYIFYPQIEDVRLRQLIETDNSRVIDKIILYSLHPLLWIMWIVLSLFAIVFTVNSSSGYVG